MPEYEEAYYIDKFGLALLLHRHGMDTVYCLDIFGSEVQVDDEEACTSLFEMAGEELVRFDENEELSLSAPLETLCRIMTGAKAAVCVYTPLQNSGAFVIYVGEEASVVAASAPNRPNVLKLFAIESDAIDACIAEAIHASRSDKEETMLFVESLAFFGLDDGVTELAGNPATAAVIEIRCLPHGECLQRHAVIRAENKQYLCTWDGAQFKTEEYSKQRIFQEFRRKV